MGAVSPHGLRYRMAYDPDLLSRVMRIFSRVVFHSMRKRASACGIPRGHAERSRSYKGSVRPESPSSCTHDLHRWRLCGFAGRESTLLSAVSARTQDVVWVAQTIATRIQALLEVDLAADDTVGEPWLAELYMDGVANRIRTGTRSGQRTSMADANEGL